MNHDKADDEAAKVVLLAENLLTEAVGQIQNLVRDVTVELEQVSGAIARTIEIQSTLESMISPEAEWSKEAQEAVEGLNGATRAMQALVKKLYNAPDFSQVTGDAVMGPITEASNLLVQMRPLSLSDRDCSKYALQTMDCLREALKTLQSVEITEPEVASATGKIAKTLAVLYPISQIHDKPSRLPTSPLKAPEEPPEVERRATPRIAIEAEIGFQSETNFFSGFTEDISTGGIFIATYDTREIGDKLSVNFTLPDGHLISVDGIVRWIREFNETTPDTMPGMGVQFEGLSSSDEEAIQGFVEQRQPLFYDE